jgi:hypothetical protein
MKGILILRAASNKRLETTSGVTYVGFSGDAYELKTSIGFRIGFIYFGSRSTEPRPSVHDADDAVPSQEYALIRG